MSFLSYAKVFHKRVTPSVNQFCYDVFYICLDIDNLRNIKSKFLSIDKFNIFSFYQKNHGARDGSNLRLWLNEILKKFKIDNVEQVMLLSHPKILNFGFNPVSFWFCLDMNNNLLAVLAEVNNTFGEYHSYLIFNKDKKPITQDQWFEAKKEFHVSPFYKVDGSYKFRFIFNKKKIAVWIDYFNDDKTLLTSIAAQNKDLNDLNLIKSFLKYPFMMFKVIVLIHWQALKILFKKNKYIPKPKQSNKKITSSGEV